MYIPMSEYRDIARQAALAAGEMIRGEVKKQHQVQCKGGFDFVTEVDRMSESLICSRLSQAFPTHGFFCEEQVSSADITERELLEQMPEYTWIIDALDGTTNFIRGIPQFAVSIALFHKGKPLVGVVYDPSRDELFEAEAGCGAYLNGVPIHVSQAAHFCDAIVSFGFPAVDLGLRSHTMSLLEKLSMKVGSVRIFNCAALLLCYAACGRTDLSFEEGIHLWDMAAGILIVQEAGGSALRMDGTALDRYARENLVGNPALVKAFLEV